MFINFENDIFNVNKIIKAYMDGSTIRIRSMEENETEIIYDTEEQAIEALDNLFKLLNNHV